MTGHRSAGTLVYHGDCREVMADLDAESIDAIVTDPPYGLGFMGKAWDHGVPGVEFWAEMLRIAKPGAYLLAFGGTRTVHRIATAIEDAGWEIRDTLVWAYASGFPKSLDVSKAIDKAAGAERPRGGKSATSCPDFPEPCSGHTGNGRYSPTVHALPTLPATPDAEKWQGWGTALKPAWEPIVLARKPLRGTVAANVLAHGTGALNIDGCRIGMSEADRVAARVPQPAGGTGEVYGFKNGVGRSGEMSEPHTLGRWPANVILTDPIFDGDTPGVVGGGEASYNPPGVFGVQRGDQPADTAAPFAVRKDGDGVFGYGDSGTYSRFFLVPKASRSDREPKGHRGERANTHPTVKPTRLMAHLLRLVTPTGGVVLDPFAGSGSTLVAALREGIEAIGIEQDAESVAIIRARLAAERPEWELIA